MKSMFSWLLVFVAIIFWIIRVVVMITNTMQIDFLLQPVDSTMEIALLFVAIICLVLIIKRNIIGAMAYLIAYGAYFGTDAYNIIKQMTSGAEGATINALGLLVSILGILLPLLILLDVAFNKGGSGTGKKTNWFYGTEDYERKLDERADKNQYKF